MMHMMHAFFYHVHMALALQMLALVSGCLLLSKAAKGEFFYKRLGKWIGVFVVIASLLSITCLTVVTIKKYCGDKEAKMESMMRHHPPIDWSKHIEEMEKKGK